MKIINRFNLVKVNFTLNPPLITVTALVVLTSPFVDGIVDKILEKIKPKNHKLL